MSGVGSTNAMKKGSANNPFLAFSEADMKGYLNSAYTGCIVKYNGDPIARKITFETANVPERAQNLVFTKNAPTFGDYGFDDLVITKKQNGSTTTEYFRCAYCNLLTGLIGPLSIGTPSGDNYVKFVGLFSSNIDTSNSNLIRACWVPDAIDSKYEYPDWWPVTPGWQEDFVNTEGKVVEWGHGEDVVFTYSGDSDAVLLLPCVITPYEVGELYKVVYVDNEYRYEEFHCISEDKTTAGAEDVAPGKTFYDFTGTKQIGTGTRANPFLARGDSDMNAFNNATYLGKFVKYIGKTNDTYVKDAIYQVTNDATEYDRYMILPALENEGKASDLAQGKQLINSQGEVVEGTLGGDIDYTQDVMFWDYDGKLIYACTLDEAKAMTKLPDAPRHDADGLVFSRWNWTLEQLHELTAPVDVGAMYAPADGNSHIFINVDRDNCEFTLWFTGNYDNSNPTIVSINWGDGNTETYSYVCNTNKHFDKTHVYSVKGEYEIIIQNISSSLTTRYKYGLGYVSTSDVSYGLCGAVVNSQGYLTKNYLSSQLTNSLFVKKVYIGDNCNNINITGCIKCSTKVGKYVGLSRGELVENLEIKHVNSTNLSNYSMYLSRIETCSFSKNIYLGYSCFGSKNLKRLAIYNNGGTGDYETLSIPSLRFISIANSFYSKYTGFPGLVFIKKATIGADRAEDTQYSSIEELTLSEMCKKINSNDFISYSAVKKLIVKNSAPPTLTNKFTNIQPDLKIYVPDESIDTYKTAKGWSEMADRIYPMSELT